MDTHLTGVWRILFCPCTPPSATEWRHRKASKSSDSLRSLTGTRRSRNDRPWKRQKNIIEIENNVASIPGYIRGWMNRTWRHNEGPCSRIYPWHWHSQGFCWRVPWPCADCPRERIPKSRARSPAHPGSGSGNLSRPRGRSSSGLNGKKGGGWSELLELSYVGKCWYNWNLTNLGNNNNCFTIHKGQFNLNMECYPVLFTPLLPV